MDIPELEAFVAIYESGSMSQAALRLNRVQSSISLRIKNLEIRLGVVLFDRRNDGVVPTDHGRVLYRYASDILKLEKEAIHAVRVPPSDGHLKVGFIEIVPTGRIDAVIDAASKKNISFDIKIGATEELVGFLQNGIIDVGIVGAGFSSPELMRTPLYSERLFLVSSARKPHIRSLSELKDALFYINSSKSASRRNVEMLFADGNCEPAKIVECGSYQVLFSSLSKGAGFSLVAETTFNEYAARYNVKSHDLFGNFSVFPVEMLWQKSMSSSVFFVFSKIMINQFRA
jgi:DNA-binding transcriptional LysR family regulator